MKEWHCLKGKKETLEKETLEETLCLEMLCMIQLGIEHNWNSLEEFSMSSYQCLYSLFFQPKFQIETNKPKATCATKLYTVKVHSTSVSNCTHDSVQNLPWEAAKAKILHAVVF